MRVFTPLEITKHAANNDFGVDIVELYDSLNTMCVSEYVRKQINALYGAMRCHEQVDDMSRLKIAPLLALRPCRNAA